MKTLTLTLEVPDKEMAETLVRYLRTTMDLDSTMLMTVNLRDFRVTPISLKEENE